MQDMQDSVKKQYILHYILRPDITGEEELHGQRTAINAKVEAAGGKIEASLCQDSARRFAYPIKRIERGYFCETAFQLDPEGVKGLYEALRLEPFVLRHLIESKSPAAKIRPNRKPKFSAQKEVHAPTPATPQGKDAQAEKISIEELDKRLDEIIKNI